MDKRLVKASKFVSLVLRHKPDAIGLHLDAHGWADVSELIAKSDGVLDRPTLEAVVAENDKKRFAFSDDGQRIRANQGHSVVVDLGLTPKTPPSMLYHGTAQRFLDAILAEGLTPQGRQHVHLSADPDTARTVGMRHGTPVILTVDADGSQRSGAQFYLSDNGVWLTDHVAPRFLALHT